ncbi:6-hydroxymethylpterin diphosphokinase MptE-like protein [Shewanella sp. 125m-7]
MNTSESNLDNQFRENDFGEHYLPSVNRNSFAKIDSKTLFKQTFGEDILKEEYLHIIIGSDSGLLINYIISQGIPSGSKYIFVELDTVLSIINTDIGTNLNKQIKILAFDEFTAQLSSDEYELYLIKNQYLTHNSIASTSGIIEQYSTLIFGVQKQLTAYKFKISSVFSNKVFLIQQLKNIPDNHYPASLLRNKFQGKTCIVIGGGPSLDDHIDWIAQHYEQLFIITVSRVAAKLSKAGIPAHIIVSIDYQDLNFEVNIDTMALAQESLLINSYHLNHRILSQWQGRALYTGPKLPWCKDDSSNIASVGPTVTNSAVHIAIELGFSTILLTGADFCYSSTGVTHAKGSVEAEAGINNSRIEEWVETYAGNLAETPVQLVSAAQTLQAEALQHPQVNIINLSINAAKLEGINYQSVEGLILKPAGVSPKQVLEMLPNTAADKIEHLKDVEAKLLSSVDAFKGIKKLSQQAIELNLQAKRVNIQSNKYRNITRKIEAIEAKIEAKFGDISYVIKSYGYGEFSKFLTTKASQHWTVEDMQNMTQLYYEAYKSLAEELNNYVQDAIYITKTRQLELAEHVDMEELSGQWKRHNQPGRVHIFQHLREQLGFGCDSENKHFIDAVTEYHTQLTAKTHPYFAMKKTNTSLHNTLAKINDLYKSKNQTGLVQLINSIESMIEDNDLAQRLYYLAQCYSCMLDGNNKAALSTLQQIDDSNQTEIILKQMVALASELQQIEITVASLAKLVTFSHEYLPLYAHALTIQGDNIQAINTYLDYLEINPNDIKVRLNLGVFLLKIGQTDGAITCFKQVLTVDIDNLSARNYLKQIAV